MSLNRRHQGGMRSAMSKLPEIDARIAGMTEGARVRICRIVGPKCPETLRVGSTGTVKRWHLGRVVVEMDYFPIPWELSYLPDELEVIGSKS